MIPSAGGFAKLYRSILDHRLWTSAPTAWLRVFLGILMSASYQPVKCWDGVEEIEIPAGAIFTSITKLSELCKVSQQQVRDALAFLSGTHLIEVSRTRRGTVVKLIASDLYGDTKETENTPSDASENTARTHGRPPKRTQQRTHLNGAATPTNDGGSEQLSFTEEHAGEQAKEHAPEHSRNSAKKYKKRCAFPETAKAVQSYFPAVDQKFIGKLVQRVAKVGIDAADEQIAAAVHSAYRAGTQFSPGLFLQTVPEALQTRKEEPQRYPTMAEQDAMVRNGTAVRR